ncbi:FxSxx-COOH system tetratricopeptide repeat protein [Parafrankia irregularis]|uniref:FxSxx-COOH system tetratricopeptide repeat protein n=1 Tax=Parafrankia irregularis TaxID=795642 RepID=UPI0013F4BECF|nr:FxSxx-COOH system tetratricopeptide repeat protein [Parafrankia irregularis]
MADGLAAEQVRAFAEVFGDPASARHVLDLAGFPAHLHPWEAPSGLLFWASVSRSLANGVLADGYVRLLTAARSLYPDNPQFSSDTLPEAEDGAPPGPVAWNVPGRLPRFVGRDDLLGQLHGALAESSRVALVALDGMGGVGKTALAVEYAHRYADSFDVVWWVPSERAELVERALAELAGSLGLPEGAGADGVWSALRAVRSWLVVFDNVEDVAAVQRFRPVSAGGRVVVTSRDRTVRDLAAAWVEVPTLDRAASVDLLTSRTAGRDRTAADRAAADRVAGLLGDLPLAVEQAAGYLGQTGMPAGEYATLLETQPGVMAGRGRLVDRPEVTVANLWGLSVQRLGGEYPAAVELLELCAWCDAEPIPLDLFASRAGQWPAPRRRWGRRGRGFAGLRAAVEDPAVWSETVGALVRYSLARRDGDTLVVHRLVAAATRQAMPDRRASEYLGVLARLLRAGLPGDVWNPAGWPAWRVLLPHALTVAEHARSRRGQVFDDGSWLADRAATYLQDHGQLLAAIDLFERTLTDRERALGADHPETLASRNNLAYAYLTVGRVEEAINLFERTLTDRERVLGADHPETLFSRSNLGGAYETAGRVEEAIDLFGRALADQERVLGADHLETLALRSALAGAYWAAGRVEEAIDLFERALADQERVLGADHPSTLLSRHDLAGAYATAGQLEEAIGLFERTLTDQERVLGADHPSTLLSRHNLAGAYATAGRAEEAIDLFERTVVDAERVLGEGHPFLATVRADLEGATLGPPEKPQPPIDHQP